MIESDETGRTSSRREMAAAKKEWEEPKQAKYEPDHRAGIVAGSRRQINHLPGGRRFVEGQVSMAATTRASESVARRHDESQETPEK
jgi:hypothetical protein